MYSGYLVKLVRVSPFAFGLRGFKEGFGCHYRWKLGTILGGDRDRSIKELLFRLSRRWHVRCRLLQPMLAVCGIFWAIHN